MIELDSESQTGSANGNQYSSLDDFLHYWDQSYYEKVKDIPLFDSELTRKWTQKQREYFVKVFYHSRGHFRDFLWHMGNFAPDKKTKDMILENISEEFNGDSLSHEQLYLDFAKCLNVNLKNEFIEEKYNIKEMKEFNLSHIRWLNSHDWDYRLSAFSAYERLDVVDYNLLSKLTDIEHPFFAIHRTAKHFEKTAIYLKKIWESNPYIVIESFEFIGNKQEPMWRELSNLVFNYHE